MRFAIASLTIVALAGCGGGSSSTSEVSTEPSSPWPAYPGPATSAPESSTPSVATGTMTPAEMESVFTQVFDQGTAQSLQYMCDTWNEMTDA